MEISKNAVICVLLVAVGILWWLCFDNIVEPQLTTSMLEESQERVVEKTDAVQRVLQKANADAAAVASRVERHVETLSSDDVAGGLNALLELSRMERGSQSGSAGLDDTGSGLLDD